MRYNSLSIFPARLDQGLSVIYDGDLIVCYLMSWILWFYLELSMSCHPLDAWHPRWLPAHFLCQYQAIS